MAERRIAVDSCVFVNVLTGGGQHDTPQWLKAGKALFRAAEQGQFTVVISALTVAEVFGAGATRGAHLKVQSRKQNIAAAYRWLTEHRFRVVETDASLARFAADLAVKYQLKGPDAIVLASAQRVRAEALCTWDKDLLKVQDKVDGLHVILPGEATIEQDLFSGGGL